MISNFDPYEFLWRHWWIPAAYLFVPLINLTLMKRFPSFRHGPRRRILSALEWLVLLVVTGVFAWQAVEPVIGILQALLNRPVVLVFVGLMLGNVLYALRRARKDFYGLIEVLFAVIAFGIVGADKTPEFTAKSIAFISAIYVYIRGVTNIEEGWVARQARAATE